MNKETEKGRVGDSFSDFLKEQGTYEKTTEQAVKRVLAHRSDKNRRADLRRKIRQSGG